MRFAYTWGYHKHRSNVYCPGAGWVDAWWQWHDKSYWTWVDTSYWVWAPYQWWVASGYWETYQEWVAGGYWADPLQATVAISKAPAYVFTRWHYLTSDGRRQNQDDEPAHMDLNIEFYASKPIKSYRVYAIVERHVHHESRYSVTLATGQFKNPQQSGAFSARGEYDYGGQGTHYVQITATDGSTATVYFDVPINSYRGLNINKSRQTTPGQNFSRSLQDTGKVSF